LSDIKMTNLIIMLLLITF